MDHLQKTKKNYKSFKKQKIHDMFIKKKLDKACFQYDMAYEGFNDLTRRTASNKTLHDKALSIAKNLVEQSKMKLCPIKI